MLYLVWFDCLDCAVCFRVGFVMVILAVGLLACCLCLLMVVACVCSAV